MRSPERKPRGRVTEVRKKPSQVRVQIVTADLWISDTEEMRALPLPILAGIHDSCLRLKEQTGDWPITVAIAPLLMARLQAEIEGDEQLKEQWPDTLVLRMKATGKPYWVLMSMPVVEVERYPPDFCRILGVKKEIIAQIGLNAFADRVTEVLSEEPREPVEGEVQ